MTHHLIAATFRVARAAEPSEIETISTAAAPDLAAGSSPAPMSAPMSEELDARAVAAACFVCSPLCVACSAPAASSEELDGSRGEHVAACFIPPPLCARPTEAAAGVEELDGRAGLDAAAACIFLCCGVCAEPDAQDLDGSRVEHVAACFIPPPLCARPLDAAAEATAGAEELDARSAGAVPCFLCKGPEAGDAAEDLDGRSKIVAACCIVPCPYVCKGPEARDVAEDLDARSAAAAPCAVCFFCKGPEAGDVAEDLDGRSKVVAACCIVPCPYVCKGPEAIDGAEDLDGRSRIAAACFVCCCVCKGPEAAVDADWTAAEAAPLRAAG